MKSVTLAALVFAAAGFSSIAAGQSANQPVNSQDCLADKLLAAQPDSIVVRFNAKIIKLLVTPETEIWRKGVDLTSPLELVADDEIYVKCAEKPAPDGTPIATIVAAVQKDSGVDLQPHHIREIRVCMGRLIRIAPGNITVQNDHGECTVRVPPGTDIWRGEIYHDTSALKLGDEIGSRVYVSYPSGELIADSVEANVVKAEGPIVSVKADRAGGVKIVVKEERVGRVSVVLDSRTKCDECATADLKRGDFVLATGLKLSRDNFRATYITLEH